MRRGGYADYRVSATLTLTRPEGSVVDTWKARHRSDVDAVASLLHDGHGGYEFSSDDTSGYVETFTAPDGFVLTARFDGPTR